MDQALASPVASYARNPAAPRTSSFWLPSEGQSQTVAPQTGGGARLDFGCAWEDFKLPPASSIAAMIRSW
jgi:hypothetical protein